MSGGVIATKEAAAKAAEGLALWHGSVGTPLRWNEEMKESANGACTQATFPNLYWWLSYCVLDKGLETLCMA